jgi:small subunit ribosomal protein S17
METKKQARHRNEKIGEVVSTKMAKTIVVQVYRTIKHARYGKYLRRKMKFIAHDEQGTAKLGDTVRIIECRPLSRRKRWRLAGVVTKAGERGMEI